MIVLVLGKRTSGLSQQFRKEDSGMYTNKGESNTNMIKY